MPPAPRQRPYTRPHRRSPARPPRRRGHPTDRRPTAARSQVSAQPFPSRERAAEHAHAPETPRVPRHASRRAAPPRSRAPRRTRSARPAAAGRPERAPRCRHAEATHLAHTGPAVRTHTRRRRFRTARAPAAALSEARGSALPSSSHPRLNATAAVCRAATVTPVRRETADGARSRAHLQRLRDNERRPRHGHVRRVSEREGARGVAAGRRRGGPVPVASAA